MRPLRALGTAVLVLLAAQIVLYLVNIGLILHELSLVARLVPDEGWERAIARSDWVGVMTLLVFVATGIVWLVWQHHAQVNIAAASPSDLRFTPGWAVGWWFIPIANLWKPFQTVRELWAESHAWGGHGGLSRWPVIWWWLLWVGSNLMAIWASSLFEEVNRLADFRRAEFVELAADALTIGAAVLAITIVRSITTLQEALRVRWVGVLRMPPLPGATPPRPDPV